MQETIMKTALVAVLCLSGQALAQPASFQGLGPAPGASQAVSAAALSADGSTVVGGILCAQGFRWRAATGWQVLHPLGPNGDVWAPSVVSADGSVVAGEL